MKTSILRLKQNQTLRDMCSHQSFDLNHLVQPLFIVEGLTTNEDIKGLPGNQRLSEDTCMSQIESDIELGVKQFILFFVPEEKTEASLKLQFQTKTLKKIIHQFGSEAQFWVDNCLCSSLKSGHCCVFHENGAIDLKTSVNLLSEMALSFAEAGAHGISPSDMMDGRSKAVRSALDENGFDHVCLMSYSTKFASQFYGPFRGAADSSPQFGDRRAYQLDLRDREVALMASRRCASEGADLLMVKPGMTSIDLIGPIAEQTGLHVGAYQVSGEYASLWYLSQQGFGDFQQLVAETWCVFRRAGATFIITYGARNAQKILEHI